MDGRVYKIADFVFYGLVAGYFIGIIFSQYLLKETLGPVSFALVSLSMSLLYVLRKKKHSETFAFFVMFFVLVPVGAFHYNHDYLKSYDPYYERYVDSEMSLEGVVVSDSDIREKSQRVVIMVTSDEGRESLFTLSAPPYPNINYKDKLLVKGKIGKPEDFQTDSGRYFDYDSYLMKDKIYYTVSFAEVEVIENAGRTFLGTLYNIKKDTVALMQKYIRGKEGVFATGITLGTRSAISEELTQLFILTGTIHLVALSGFNITLVTRTISSIANLFLAKRAAILFSLVSIALFVLLVGATTTAVRAGIMAAVAMAAIWGGNMYSVMRSLVVATFLMVVFNPFTLVHDISFHLSVVATLGIIFICPIFNDAFSFIKNNFWRDIFSSTLSAQTAVLPLVLYTTGVMSFISPITNVIIAPIIPYAMTLSFLTVLAGLIFPFLGYFVGYVVYVLNKVTIAIIEYTGSLSYAATYVREFSLFGLLAIYFALIAFIYFQHKRLNIKKYQDLNYV